MSEKQALITNKSNLPIKYKNIALAGDVGTGTTTLGKTLAATLGWQHTNAGAYFRAWHQQHNIPLEQTQNIPESVDRQLDQRFQRDMATVANTVFESHLAGWLAKDIPTTFRLLCIADSSVTMARIAAREGWTLDQAIAFSQQRTQGLNAKFSKLYGVADPYLPHYFNAVIDTTNLSAGEVLDSALRHFLGQQPGGQALAKVLEVDL